MTDDGRVTWHAGPVPPGPAVVVDLDGVVSDTSGRIHHVTTPGQKKDWKAFFAGIPDDALVEELHRLLELLDPALVVVLVSGRPAGTRDATVAWLARHDVRWDLLLLRAADDHRPAPEVKLEALGALRGLGYDVRLAVEDDARNADMFRRAGVPCVQVTAGSGDPSR